MRGHILTPERMNVLSSRCAGMQPYYVSLLSLKDELDDNNNINSEKSETTIRSGEMKIISLNCLSTSKERLFYSRSTQFHFQYLEEQ
jgi:hypothetical protein